MKRKNEKDHDRRKSPGSAEVFQKQRREHNQARPKQRWVPSSLNGAPVTFESIDNMTDEQVLAIVPAHWERPRLQGSASGTDNHPSRLCSLYQANGQRAIQDRSIHIRRVLYFESETGLLREERDREDMTTLRQDRYTFPNNEVGKTLRTTLAESLLSQGITTECGEEAVVLLTLTVTGKRPGAGRIAEDMKARDKRRTSAL